MKTSTDLKPLLCGRRQAKKWNRAVVEYHHFQEAASLLQ